MFRLLFLGNGWADCVEIWYALGNPLATAYAVVTDGVSLHVRTCTLRFCISQTARPIVLKFGGWVSSHYLSAFHKSWVGYLCTCARAPPSLYLGIPVANCAKIWWVARDPIVTRFTGVRGGVTTFARASPVSFSRKPLSPGIEATPKTDLSLSRSLVHRQTWRLTGFRDS